MRCSDGAREIPTTVISSALMIKGNSRAKRRRSKAHAEWRVNDRMWSTTDLRLSVMYRNLGSTSPEELFQSAQPLALDLRRCRRVRAPLAGRLQRHPIQRCKQFRQRHVQRIADVRERLDRRIRDAPLDCRNVGAVDERFEGQRFLRFLSRMPTLLDPFAQGNRDRSRSANRWG